MRVVLMILFLVTGIQAASAQACGVYRLEYKATLTSDSLELKSIMVPTTAYLHGLEDFESNLAYVEYDLESESFSEMMGSHLSCYVLSSNRALFNLFTEARESIIIEIKVLNDKKEETIITRSIDWNDVILEPPSDKAKVVLNLGELSF